MNVRSQKKLAAKVLKVGLSRVKVLQEKEVEEAITREDIRRLVTKGFITKVEKGGMRKVEARHRRAQKKKGRRKKEGSRKGAKYARKPKKRQWVERVRPLRKMLRELKETGKLSRNDYRKLYSLVKGGSFRSKKHLLYYMKEHELLKEVKKVAKTSPEKRGAKK